jgi:hypothetical protein
MTIDPENPLLVEVLSGSASSYTYKPDESISEVSFFGLKLKIRFSFSKILIIFQVPTFSWQKHALDQRFTSKK